MYNIFIYISSTTYMYKTIIHVTLHVHRDIFSFKISHMCASISLKSQVYITNVKSTHK